MFVGASGVGRVVQRSVELMKEHDTDEIRQFGGIDVATLQRYLNFHYSVSLDLFGAETSTNAANYYAAGLKGRYHEEDRSDDHQLKNDSRTIATMENDQIGEREVPSLTALNATLRDDYVEDCAKGVERWNRTLAQVGCELRLPHVGFHRAVGEFAGAHVTPDGLVVSSEEWEKSRSQWVPTDDDQQYVESLMQPVRDPGKMAGWVAPPANGLHGKPVDYEYVKL
jgi:benzoyl-CoA 2,3-dioxygenase component B